MKFFSNEAKENEPGYDREHSDVVTSDPVAVPQQRAGSPWSDAPGSPDGVATDTATATATDTGTRPDEDEAGSPDDELADRERRDGTDEPLTPDDEHSTTTYGPDGTVTTEEPHDTTTAEEEDAPAARRDEEEDVPAARQDEEEEEDVPAARRDEVTDVTLPPTADDTAPAEIKDEGTFESPEVVDAATGDTVTEDERGAVGVAAVPVAAAAAATPGGTAAPALDRLFTDGDSFAERFRDIQLRFVDSPKEATADAAALVGEAVDRLTDALKAQKDALHGDSDDTEQLRVQLRSYRDLLNRLSAL